MTNDEEAKEAWEKRMIVRQEHVQLLHRLHPYRFIARHKVHKEHVENGEDPYYYSDTYDNRVDQFVKEFWERERKHLMKRNSIVKAVFGE